MRVYDVSIRQECWHFVISERSEFLKMSKEQIKKETFVVNIIDTQNSSWQGTVSWTGEKSVKPFRSALELIKLIDSAMVKGEE